MKALIDLWDAHGTKVLGYAQAILAGWLLIGAESGKYREQLTTKLKDGTVEFEPMGLDGIEKRLAEARRKLAASGLVFRVRSLDSEDGDRIRRQYPEKKGATDDEQVDVYNARFLEQMAAQIFHPKKFTVSELKQLRAAVGEPEFGKLFEACQEVTSRTAASSPFSPAASGMNLS